MELASRIADRLFADLHHRRNLLERFNWASPESLPPEQQDRIRAAWSRVVARELVGGLDPGAAVKATGGRAGVECYETWRARPEASELSLDDWLSQSTSRRVCVQPSLTPEAFLCVLQVGPHGHGIATHWGRAPTGEGAVRAALSAWSREGLSVNQLARLQRSDLGLTESELEQLATNVRLPNTPTTTPTDDETQEG